jgi:propanediol dehydratase large subunit
MTTTGAHGLALVYTKKKVALKATIMPAMEMKSVASPIINFEGNDFKKSSSVQRDMRIDKNITIEVEEEHSVIASEMKNTINQLLFTKIGVPVS